MSDRYCPLCGDIARHVGDMGVCADETGCGWKGRWDGP